VAFLRQDENEKKGKKAFFLISRFASSGVTGNCPEGILGLCASMELNVKEKSSGSLQLFP
jgi:hypothetical protein